MKIKKEYTTKCLGLDLILALGENDRLLGARTQEGGSYPLLDFEYDEIFKHLSFQKEGRCYGHVYLGSILQ